MHINCSTICARSLLSFIGACISLNAMGKRRLHYYTLFYKYIHISFTPPSTLYTNLYALTWALTRADTHADIDADPRWKVFGLRYVNACKPIETYMRTLYVGISFHSPISSQYATIANPIVNLPFLDDIRDVLFLGLPHCIFISVHSTCTHTHITCTHTHIYIYIYVCVFSCVCVLAFCSGSIRGKGPRGLP